MPDTLIIAHRGACMDEVLRGNTLEAYHQAVCIGADMIECDVRRTHDQVLVLHHDATIDGHLIRKMTYRAVNKAAKALGFHVPTLAELLDVAKDRIRLDVEVKEQGYELAVTEQLLDRLEPEEFVVTSFNDDSVRLIKQGCKQVRTGLLLGKAVPKNVMLTRFREVFPSGRCRRTKVDFLAPHFRLLKLGLLRRAKKSHRPVFVWTVNDEAMMRKLLQDSRVAGIITDRADVAVSVKKRLAERKPRGTHRLSDSELPIRVE